jgi:hypothetical protein
MHKLEKIGDSKDIQTFGHKHPTSHLEKAYNEPRNTGPSRSRGMYLHALKMDQDVIS